MKKNLIAFAPLLALATSLLVSGCYSTVEGNSKTGVPFVRDSIVSRYDRSIAQMTTTAKTVLSQKGTLISDNTIGFTIHGKVNGSDVWVKFEDINGTLTQMTVQARHSGGRSDLDLAIEIDRQIAVSLTAGK